MKNKLPEGWKEVTLGEVAEFINGRAFKPSEWENKGKMIIRIQDLTGNIENPNFTTKTLEEKYLVKKGDLLISWSATLDAFIWNKEDGWLNQHIFKVAENKKIIDKKYLFYLIKTKIDEMKKNTHGSTMKHITKGNFESVDLILPTVPTQKKIVSILEKAEKAKEWRKEADELTKDYLKSVFMEMFLKENFELREIGEVCETSSGGTPSRDKNEYWENGNILWVKSGELDKGYIYDTEEKITELALKNSSAKYFKPNTVLLAMYGATVGKTALLKVRATTNQAICGIVPKEITNLNPIYLLHMFFSLKDKLISKSVGGGQPNISQLIIKETRIQIPPIELQNKFALIVKEVEAMKDLQKYSKEHLNNLFNALMQKAFKCELI